MTEERSEHIRELQLRISQWEQESSHAVQQERGLQSNLRQTLSLSLRVVMIGSIPAVIWLICWSAVHTAIDSTFGKTLFTGASLAAYGIVAAGAARASGLFAHWWFYRSDVRQRVATITIALSADALLFWWVVVLARW